MHRFGRFIFILGISCFFLQWTNLSFSQINKDVYEKKDTIADEIRSANEIKGPFEPIKNPLEGVKVYTECDPILNPIGNRTAQDLKEIRISVSATSPCEDYPLRLNVTTANGDPVGTIGNVPGYGGPIISVSYPRNLQPLQGEFIWTAVSIGPFGRNVPLTFEVVDPTGRSDSENITITITN